MAGVESNNETNKMWVRVCALDEIPTDKALSLHINTQRLTLARCGDIASVLQGVCSHMLFPLAGSRGENSVLTRHLHFTTFNIVDETGIDLAPYPPLSGK